ncbi:MAG: helix-turn-helix domain-containing protein [Anaerolineae bacterium]
MTIRVRSVHNEERQTLEQWERAAGVVAYRHARALLLSAHGQPCARIAEALGLHVQTVRDLIKAFNAGGPDAGSPRPRSGGRPPTLPPETGATAEDLTRRTRLRRRGVAPGPSTTAWPGCWPSG